MIINQLKGLEQRVADSFKTVHDNVQSLKRGLDSAEFNLRAHQKVLNAMAVELEQQFGDMAELKLADVKIPTEADDGEKDELIIRRINWAFYHKEVEDELRRLLELEKAEQERIAEEKAKLEAETKKAALEEEKAKLEEQLADLKKEAEEAGNNPEEVETEAKKVLEQFQKVSEELGKMVRGEPHDQEVIAEAQQMIEEDERKHPDGATIFGD